MARLSAGLLATNYELLPSRSGTLIIKEKIENVNIPPKDCRRRRFCRLSSGGLPIHDSFIFLSKVIDKLAHDLRTAFPEMKGFSRSNLMYMRAFAEAWPDEQIVQQVVGQLPWGHNLVLLTRLKQPDQRLAYAQAAVEHSWSRNVLNIHIETQLLERKGKAVTNFYERLPAPGSDLARESLKDPYVFDFLDIGKEADEREIESALVKQKSHAFHNKLRKSS